MVRGLVVYTVLLCFDDHLIIIFLSGCLGALQWCHLNQGISRSMGLGNNTLLFFFFLAYISHITVPVNSYGIFY